MPAPEPPRAPEPRLVCTGCGAATPRDEPRPFRCPEQRPGDDIDHVLRPELNASEFPRGPEPQPHARYRRLAFSYQFARARGLSDDDYLEAVAALDGAVSAVDGRGFVTTPCAIRPEVGAWVKDDTGNVGDSHKARHLFGVMLHLRLLEQLGLGDPQAPLAIASCGNAALAAAVIARAAERHLQVFVPPDAEDAVTRRLRDLGADVVVCARQDAGHGDPCIHAFHDAVERGALPFGCQGNDNGLTIDGGKTLAYELIEAAGQIDALFVQVGGGALASACAQAFADAVALGALTRIPRIHAVQTTGAAPLARAYQRLADRLATRLQIEATDPAERASAITDRCTEDDLSEELRFAASHRSQFMSPWEETPASIARGILDDEAYDWHAVVAGMLSSGGYPVVVSDEVLRQAHALGNQAGVRVCPTGSAGLAGLLQLRSSGAVGDAEQVAVVFTGLDR